MSPSRPDRPAVPTARVKRRMRVGRLRGVLLVRPRLSLLSSSVADDVDREHEPGVVIAQPISVIHVAAGPPYSTSDGDKNFATTQAPSPSDQQKTSCRLFSASERIRNSDLRFRRSPEPALLGPVTAS